MLEQLESSILLCAENAAIAAKEWAGRGNEKQADQAAVTAMRNHLNSLDIKGRIAVGEGERDKAPLLYAGEEVGTGNGPEIDIALDPLEGTTICATNNKGAMAVIAIAKKGDFLCTPDIYMHKLATGKNIRKDVVNLEDSITTTIKNIAQYTKKETKDIHLIVLDRPRHEEIISKAREAGLRVSLIKDGDIAATINVALGYADLYCGSGGAPEGVLSATALKALGGNIQGKLVFNNDEEVQRALKMGTQDPTKLLHTEDMIKGESIFFASAITEGLGLNGLHYNRSRNIITVDSLVIKSTARQCMTRIQNQILLPTQP